MIKKSYTVTHTRPKLSKEELKKRKEDILRRLYLALEDKITK